MVMVIELQSYGGDDGNIDNNYDQASNGKGAICCGGKNNDDRY